MTVATSILLNEFSGLASELPVMGFVRAPTPLRRHTLDLDCDVPMFVKHDEASGELYGGNKVRKLDFILARAKARGAEQIATFGAVGSHHALATALYARAEGFEPICFLGHQPSTEHVYETLSAHLANGTTIVRFGGIYANRLLLLRRHFARARTWVVPAGGSSWLGAVGFIDAGLELARQLEAFGGNSKGRLFVANGTMGTVAGLALGLALAESNVEVQAVRVTSEAYASRKATLRLMKKACELLARMDPRFPRQLFERTRVRYRHSFVGDGYTRPTRDSDQAIALAAEQLSLKLENTYTGKAFAALLADANEGRHAGERLIFWNTYNAQPLPASAGITLGDTGLPDDFARYFPSSSGS